MTWPDVDALAVLIVGIAVVLFFLLEEYVVN